MDTYIFGAVPQSWNEGSQKSDAFSLFFGAVPSAVPSSLVSIAKSALLSDLKSQSIQPWKSHLYQWDGHQVDNLGDHGPYFRAPGQEKALTEKKTECFNPHLPSAKLVFPLMKISKICLLTFAMGP